ncbi:MAG: peptidylprolyl isomerase [candidate division Zixibacteria bacterium]|nr:peptidylprolyl isomerase [candidate division Zixibacteria bacterium]
MLQDFRRYTKAFIYVAIVAFVGTIIFAWGADMTSTKAQKGIAGEVNGEEITLRTYESVIQNFYQQMSQSSQRELTQDEILELRNRAWVELVTDIVYSQTMEKLGLTLTNTELAEHLKRWPPQIVQQQELFRSEQGGFDYQAYLASMQDPQYTQFWVQVESFSRNEIRNMKLQELAIMAARITGEDVKQEFIDNNELMKFEYAALFQDQLKDPEILNDTSEVLEYYEAHQDMFFREAEAQLKYVEYAKVPNQSDSLGTKEQVQSIYDEIKDGADFAQLAADLSEDASAQSGGDLGWFNEGMMVKGFEEAVFGLSDSGDVSEPVETEFGWHVIQKTGERITDDKKEIRASHILIKFKPSGQTISDLQNAGQTLLDMIEQSDFDAAAAELGLTVGHSSGFQEGERAGILGESPRANQFAFSSKVGDVSSIIEEPARFLVVQLEEYTPEGIKSFEESYGRANSNLTQKKLGERVLAKAQEVYDLVVSGTAMEDAASQVGAEYYTTSLISRRDPVRRLGTDPAFLGTAFSLSADEPLSRPIMTGKGAAVINFLERQAPNLELFTSEQDSIHQSVLSDLRQKKYQEWFGYLQESNDVKDFRSEMFDMY